MKLKFRDDIYVDGKLIAKKDKEYDILRQHTDKMHYCFIDECDFETYVNPFNVNHKCRLIKEN